MIQPDSIVLIINFAQSDKFRTQVASKDFILGKPDQNEDGYLETRLQNELGTKKISCRAFSLIKVPIRYPGSNKTENRARGAIGLFRYLGTSDELENTIKKIKEICTEAMTKPIKKPYSNWAGFEIYLAERWLE